MAAETSSLIDHTRTERAFVLHASKDEKELTLIPFKKGRNKAIRALLGIKKKSNFDQLDVIYPGSNSLARIYYYAKATIDNMTIAAHYGYVKKDFKGNVLVTYDGDKNTQPVFSVSKIMVLVNKAETLEGSFKNFGYL